MLDLLVLHPVALTRFRTNTLERVHTAVGANVTQSESHAGNFFIINVQTSAVVETVLSQTCVIWTLELKESRYVWTCVACVTREDCDWRSEIEAWFSQVSGEFDPSDTGTSGGVQNEISRSSRAQREGKRYLCIMSSILFPCSSSCSSCLRRASSSSTPIPWRSHRSRMALD